MTDHIALIQEGNALRQHLRQLKAREAELLSELRNVMEATAEARLKLGRVNDEVARLAEKGAP